ncbi:MAG: bifunctional 4-hydroxy-2-oxoglutarate aldolase/2-dehydro-3-deoxy-phosphogluconate aldolase [Clostridiales bacterium]|jgi:2-dehydro-3-deoxyphosphogluconate aldolase/(4S)-4-hydroxy-2-oxoglutarate aldolase|nr:bifunctional 4-hydroxy-2-oxoglutarate aldolase/2-dehydro-3-deoxy-phosphogluconate aldolase [Clostridiales bacterium]
MANTLELLDKHKIIVILRRVPEDKCLPLAETLYRGGIRLVELTFDQAGDMGETAKVIDRLRGRFDNKISFGAGTVISAEQVELAAKAGAEYIISPNTDESVISRTRELGLVSIPGALTPTEILSAHRAGAHFVKLFPAGIMGAAYIKALRAPVPHVRLIAVGGVSLDNITDFLQAGACGFGIGSAIAEPELIREGRFERLEELARTYTDVAGGLRTGTNFI